MSSRVQANSDLDRRRGGQARQVPRTPAHLNVLGVPDGLRAAGFGPETGPPRAKYPAPMRLARVFRAPRGRGTQAAEPSGSAYLASRRNASCDAAGGARRRDTALLGDLQIPVQIRAKGDGRGGGAQIEYAFFRGGPCSNLGSRTIPAGATGSGGMPRTPRPFRGRRAMCVCAPGASTAESVTIGQLHCGDGSATSAGGHPSASSSSSRPHRKWLFPRERGTHTPRLRIDKPGNRHERLFGIDPRHEITAAPCRRRCARFLSAEPSGATPSKADSRGIRSCRPEIPRTREVACRAGALCDGDAARPEYP